MVGFGELLLLSIACSLNIFYDQNGKSRKVSKRKYMMSIEKMELFVFISWQEKLDEFNYFCASVYIPLDRG